MKTRLTILSSIAALMVAAPAFAQIESKDSDPAPTAGFAPLAVGGPDTFGYLFSDDAEPTCAFSFIDISASGTLIGDGDDVGFDVAFAGPGSFNFYGTDYAGAEFSTNGSLAFPTGSLSGGDLSNDCPLPATPSTGGGGRIYPIHDDLDLEPAIGRGFYQYIEPCTRASDSFPGAQLGCHVFQWDDISHFPGGGGAATWDFQVLLYDRSWEIVFQHGAGNPETGSSSTSGIQNDGATDGLTYACNVAASVNDNSAQCFTHPFPDPALLIPEVIPTLDWRGLVALMALMGLIGVVVTRKRMTSS